jgi:colicin import membrane protein
MSAAVGALQYQEPGKVPSVALAVAVHVLLAVFLFYGVRWQSRQAEAVMVELWESPPAPVAEQPVAQPEPPPQSEIKPEPKVEKAVEPPKPDIALEKKKEVKKEPPKKPEPKLNLDRSKDIRAQLESETAALERTRILDQMKREGAASAVRADAAYVSKLKGKIKGNVVVPPNIPGNPEAIFDVVQLPTGEVMSVKLRKSSGHKAYDDAVERAILKSSPLPRPDTPEQFQRSLAITFRPLD